MKNESGKMKNWKEYKLGEMIDCNPTVKLKKGELYPVIDIDKIEIGKRYVTNKDYVVYDGQSSSKFQNGDTLLARITPCLENGKVATCKIDKEFGFGSTEFFVFRGLKNKTDNDFVFYFMSSSFIRKLAANSMTGASGRQRADLTFIKNRKFYFPNFIVQQKIANILSRYDEAIENNNKRIKLLEQMAQNIYKEWFVRFRFPGWQDAEFENGVPKGWTIQKLENFGINLESGSRPSGGVDTSLDDGIPSLGAECVNGLAEFDYSNIKYIPKEYYNKMKRGKNKGNHILIYKDGAYIGKVTIFKNQFPFEKYAINEHVFFLNTKDNNYLNWLYFTLKQESYFNLMQNLNRNAAQPGLSQPDIGRIKTRFPSEDIVIKFNKFVEPIFNTVFDLAKVNNNLGKQRDLLLPRLMSGKLEIK